MRLSLRRIRLLPKTYISVVVACAAALSACGSTGSSQSTVGAEQILEGVRFPLTDRGQSSDADSLDHARAIEKLIGSCMDRARITYLPTGIVEARPEERPFGVVNLSDARSYGYAHSDAVQALLDKASEVRTRTNETLKAMPDVDRNLYHLTLNGAKASGKPVETPYGSVMVPTEGCRAEAANELYSGHGVEAAELDVVMSEMRSEAAVSAATDPSVVSAAKGWADCMAGKDYPEFTDPMNIGSSFLSAIRARSLSQQEVAVADVECKGSTAYLTTIVLVTLRAQESQVSEKSELFARYLELDALATANAKTILARG